MANSFVTLRDIARCALPHLMSNLVFPRLIHCDFSDALSAKQGDTVQVRKPVNYVARDFDPEAGTQTQELEEGSVEVKLDKIASVDIEVSALDAALNFDSVERLFIEPAAIALAEKLNACIDTHNVCRVVKRSQVIHACNICNNLVIDENTLVEK